MPGPLYPTLGTAALGPVPAGPVESDLVNSQTTTIDPVVVTADRGIAVAVAPSGRPDRVPRTCAAAGGETPGLPR